MRKLSILNIAFAIVIALTAFSFASDGVPFHLYNPDFVTNDLDATYIQGVVDPARGQLIVVNGVDSVVAEKRLPDTGQKCEFRIKIPRAFINEEESNSYAVTAVSKDGERIRTTYARITYKARKKQEIVLAEKEYDLEFPGEPVTIDASSSAGLDLDYVSSNEDIVRVDEEGNLEPVSGGTAEISVSQSNSNEYQDASTVVKVSVKEVPHYTVRFHLGKNAAGLVKKEDTDSNSGEKEESEQADDSEKPGDSEDTHDSGGDKDSEESGEGSEDKDAQETDKGDEGSGDINADDLVVEQKIAVGESANLLETAEAKGDYEFIGWASSETGYPAYENAEEVKDLAADGQTVDLYGVWHGERAQKAVDWAVALAADDRYGYGQGTPKCNICGLMPKKLYTCMPFLAAAYAHGAGDPIEFSNGKHVIHLNDKNFGGKLGQIWEKVGLCKNLTIDDLKPGDVIIKWSDNDASGHAWMYAGGDLIVEAVPAKSYADQIAVKSGAAAKLRRYGHSEGPTGKNYVMRYRF